MEEVLSGFNAAWEVSRDGTSKGVQATLFPLELGPGVKVGRNGAWVGQEWGPLARSTTHINGGCG